MNQLIFNYEVYVLYLCTLYCVGNIPDKQKYNCNYAIYVIVFSGTLPKKVPY